MQGLHVRKESLNRYIPLRSGSQSKGQMPRSLTWTWAETGRVWLPMLAWALSFLAFWQLTGTRGAQGYEISIYSALPPAFWYLLLSSLVLHVIVAARVCFGHNLAGMNQVAALLGITGVAVVTILVLLLPCLRGYPTISGDFGTHISRSAEIASESNIGSDVFYPFTYALVQVISVLTGVDVRDIWLFGAAGLHVLYILLCVLTAKRLSKDNRPMVCAGLAAAIPVAGAYLRTMSPASISVRLLPLLVYLYLNSRNKKSWGFNLLLVVLLILLPLIHPLTALMGILWLALIELVTWILIRGDVGRPSLAITPSVILAITWFLWFSSFALWNSSIRSVVSWLRGEASTQLSQVGRLIGRSGMSPIESVLVMLKQENGIIIYVGLALATLLVYHFPAFKNSHKHASPHYLQPIYVLLIVSLIAAVAALVGPFGGLDIYRFSRFLVPWATLIIALVPMMGALLAPWGRLLADLVVVFALVIAAVGGIWALHPSPYVFQPNDQVTVQDMACMKWISQWGDGRAVKGIWGTARLAQVALGYSASQSMAGIHQSLPDHFGYDQVPYVATALKRPAYILITEHDRTAVLDLWAAADKYVENDFRRLETDPSVVLLYSNSQCSAWATRSWENHQTQ